MRRFCEILIICLTLIAFEGCNSWSGFKADDEMIARVGTSYLYRSELASAMPSGIAAQDSINYSQAYISKWIVGQLKQQEAEKLFSQSESDIDRLVEEYRRSLLVHRLDRHYLEAEPCAEITNKEITEFYIEVTTDQPIMFGFGVEYGNAFGCDDATNFDWATGTTIPANDAKWYKFDISDLKANEEQVKLTFTNTADSIAWVVAAITRDCPWTVAMPLVFPVPAGASVDKWIDYSVFEASRLKHFYLGVTTREAAIELDATWEDARIAPSEGCLNATGTSPCEDFLPGV